jgi:WD40 repeat protein
MTETLVLGTGDNGLRAVCILPGDVIATAGDDGTVRCWDPMSGKMLSEMQDPRHFEPVWSLAALPDGRLATASFDSSIKIHDSKSGQNLFTLCQHTDWVQLIQLLPDGRLLSAGHDGKMCVWDVETGACALECEEHTDEISAVAVLGNALITASFDRTLRVWDLSQETSHGACRGELVGHQAGVTAVVALRDGRVVSGDDKGCMLVWSIQPHINEPIDDLPGHTARVTCLVHSGGGQLVSGSEDGSIRVWREEPTDDETSWVCRHVLKEHGDGVECILPMPGGLTAASSSKDGSVRVWDLEQGVCTVARMGHDDEVHGLALLSDGRLVSVSDDGTARVWSSHG